MLLLGKALTKYEGPSFVELHRFLNFNQLPASKKGFKNDAAQQTFDPSYFDTALVSNWNVK